MYTNAYVCRNVLTRTSIYSLLFSTLFLSYTHAHTNIYSQFLVPSVPVCHLNANMLTCEMWQVTVKLLDGNCLAAYCCFARIPCVHFTVHKSYSRRTEWHKKKWKWTKSSSSSSSSQQSHIKLQQEHKHAYIHTYLQSKRKSTYASVINIKWTTTATLATAAVASTIKRKNIHQATIKWQWQRHHTLNIHVHH